MVGLHQSSDNNMVEMYVEATNATDIPTLSVPARRTQEAGPPKPHASYGDENLVGRFSESLFEFSEYDEDIVPLVDDDDTTLVDESDFFEVASDGQDLDVEADITSQPATSTFFFPLTTMVSLHYLSGNNLSGDVSDSIDNITSWTKGAEPPDAEIIAAGIIPFTVLDLSCNRLTGSIPMQITQLKTLGVLNMSRNLLSGQIPISLRNLEALEVLDLSYNNLFGELHPELTALTTTYGGRY
ncbi:LRR receptor kinase SERK2-like [Hibiscus syriacus]|uniref:LRR receptor kinase SERK2-like n=1 Tax=Hibiscus syriacus TaxID=106335 RepID=UPI00192513A7|nr:LRR receptor kinase SERK2-like [Hibiscus syriacus]